MSDDGSLCQAIIQRTKRPCNRPHPCRYHDRHHKEEQGEQREAKGKQQNDEEEHPASDFNTQEDDTATHYQTQSSLCKPVLRDPIAVGVFSYLVNPSPLRLTCEFLKECYYHHLYLEVLPTPTAYMRQFAPSEVPSDSTGPGKGGKQKVSNKKVVVTKNSSSSSSSFGDGGEAQVGRTARDAPWPVVPTMTAFKLAAGVVRASDGLHPVVLPSFYLTKLVLVGLTGLVYLDFLPPCVASLTVANLPQLVRIVAHGTPESKLQFAKFCDLPALTKLDSGFWKHCKMLEKVSLQRLSRLQDIEAGSWRELPKLQRVQLQDLPSLESLGRCVLGYLPALTTFTLSDLPKLRTVGDEFLSSCDTLGEVRICRLPLLKTLGCMTLANCSQVTKVTFSHVPNLLPESYLLEGSKETMKTLVVASDSCHPRLVQKCKELVYGSNDGMHIKLLTAESEQ